MIRVNVYLPPEMIERLKDRKKATGVPVAEIVRRSIEAELAKGDGKPKAAGA